jgi:hypothetical protein
MRFALCAFLLAGLALAGCSSTPSPTPSATPAPSVASYTVVVQGFPVAPVPANTTFSFTDHITGDAIRASDHIGAHFGNQTTASPSTTAYPVACVHTHGDLPGDYGVTCTAPKAVGTYFLRGHARITQGNQTLNWWSSELVFTVV